MLCPQVTLVTIGRKLPVHIHNPCPPERPPEFKVEGGDAVWEGEAALLLSLQEALQPPGFSASFSSCFSRAQEGCAHKREIGLLVSIFSEGRETEVQEDTRPWNSRGPEPCPELSEERQIGLSTLGGEGPGW